jgi:hypothetical protein
MVKCLSVFFVLFGLSLVQIKAQKMNVTGRVFDSTGVNPLEKASVLAV